MSRPLKPKISDKELEQMKKERLKYSHEMIWRGLILDLHRFELLEKAKKMLPKPD